MEQKKLYRDMTHKKLSGVCGGLGKFLGIDPTLVRLLWVLVSFFAGCFVLGTIIYVICACVIDEEPPYQPIYRDGTTVDSGNTHQI